MPRKARCASRPLRGAGEHNAPRGSERFAFTRDVGGSHICCRFSRGCSRAVALRLRDDVLCCIVPEICYAQTDETNDPANRGGREPSVHELAALPSLLLKLFGRSAGFSLRARQKRLELYHELAIDSQRQTATTRRVGGRTFHALAMCIRIYTNCAPCVRFADDKRMEEGLGNAYECSSLCRRRGCLASKWCRQTSR